MRTLFTYCIPIDDGAAPNPYWGVCTLVICKPTIRRAAEVGDWIVGTGSVNSPIGNISGKIVYAMLVSQKMTMEKYDLYTKDHLPGKVPNWFSRDIRRRLGDSIYDYSIYPPKLRQSVHNSGNRARDLRGLYALLSDHFFYFADQPVQLPNHLLPIVKQGSGHRSHANDNYIETFLVWLNNLGLKPNHLYGKPQYKIFKDDFID